MKKEITLNTEQKLFIIPESGGYSCLGFDVLETRYTKLASELVNLGLLNCPQPAVYGTLERYQQYREIVEIARQHNAATGWRSKSELTPELIGLENKRVEVAHRWPGKPVDRVRFWVGKSSGFIPIHLQIARRNCLGGPAVCLGEIMGVRLITAQR